MTEITYPSIKLVDAIKKKVSGYTNGDVIFVNVFSGLFTEENVMDDLNMVTIHELIHTIDMTLLEMEVEKMTDRIVI